MYLVELQNIEPKEACQSIENVMNGHTFAEVEHRSLFGDINPNYLTPSIHKTNTAILAARCLFKIADVIERGNEDEELYFGVPYHASNNNENIPELSENIEACKFAKRAMLLNSKDVQKGNYTRPKFEISYQGQKILEKYDSDLTYATPIIESFNKVGCIGSLAIAGGSFYMTHKIGNEVIDLSKTNTISDVLYEALFAFNGIAVGGVIGKYANEIRGVVRAKKVHLDFKKYSVEKLNSHTN